MRKLCTLLLILCFTIASIFEMQIVNAEPKTIVVPDDYASIQEAINVASDGDTVFVKKGTYDFPVNQTLVINKTISFIGEDAENTIINLHPRYVEPDLPFSSPYYEHAITIEANDVILSGLKITSVAGSLFVAGQRTQITGNIITTGLFLASSYVNVSNNTITLGIWCGGYHHTIEGNKIVGGGIVVNGGGSNMIYENAIIDCNTEIAGYGIQLGAGDGNTVFNNTIKNCNHAVAILGRSSSNKIYTNSITNNIGGLELFGQGSNNAFYANYVAYNQYGILLSYTYMRTAGENNTVYHNNFVNNIEQINTSPTYYGNYGSAVSTYPTGNYDNGKEGNYWSDYNGTDNDGDGIGDTPYVIDENRTDNYPLMEPIEIPEFSSWIVLPLTLLLALIVIVLRKNLAMSRNRLKND